jgi:hypothetical protein
MWALIVFGRALEMLMGAWRLLVLYALAALGGGLVSSLFREETLSAGASGAVWGLMLAELVILLRPQVLFEGVTFTVSKSAVLQPLVLNLIWSLQPGIDLLGHLGGGLAGALVVGSGLLGRTAEAPGWRWAGSGAAALMALSLGLAFARGRPWELRAPVLEARAVPALGVGVPVPRGLLPSSTTAETVTFGRRRQDPLVIQAAVFPEDAPVPAEKRREVLRQTAEAAAARPLERGAQRERAPSVVDLPQGPAYHEALRFPNGARLQVWQLVDGERRLQLIVVQEPGAPAAWDQVPEQIVRGLAFPRTP